MRPLIGGNTARFICQRGLISRLPHRVFPGIQAHVHRKICSRNRMCSQHNFHVVACFKVIHESVNVGAYRIPHDRFRGLMDDIRAVRQHFVTSVLTITTWTTITSCVSNQPNFSTDVHVKGALGFFHHPEAFSACAMAVAIVYDDPCSPLCTHFYAFLMLTISTACIPTNSNSIASVNGTLIWLPNGELQLRLPQ
jgi:hypothetical protein